MTSRKLPLSTILLYVQLKSRIILAFSGLLVIYAIFWAALLNTNPAGILNQFDDPFFAGTVTIDTLPKRLVGQTDTKITVDNSRITAITLTFKQSLLQDAIAEMETTNRSVAHFAYVTFRAPFPPGQANPSLHNGDFLDIQISDTVATALIDENNTSSEVMDPNSDISIIVPIANQIFSPFIMNLRLHLLDFSKRTSLTLSQIQVISIGLALALVVVFVLYLRSVYHRAKYDAYGELILMSDNNFPDDLDA